MPGSSQLAELREGAFHSLELPAEWRQLSLAADHTGELSCLVERAAPDYHSKDDSLRRWVLHLTETGWRIVDRLPYDGGDRLEFDSAGRLWALGTAPRAGFYQGGRWTTYAYSNDAKLSFWSLHMAETPDGAIVLFSQEEVPQWGNSSRMKGTLTFRGGRFIREAKALATKWNEVEKRLYAERRDDTGFDRAHGYVGHSAGRTFPSWEQRTVLRTADTVVVSLGGKGLAWMRPAELAAVPALPDGEWEAIHDVSPPPTLDAVGDLWVGRGRRLLKISRGKTEEMAGELPDTGRPCTIDFDPLGRPWVMRWHGSEDRPVAVGQEGKLVRYSSLAQGFRAEGSRFPPGRIFPFAVKSPDGTIVIAGGYFEACTIIDSQGDHTFSADQINPRVEKITGHGYNAFRGAEPWYDADGRIYTRSKDETFAYESRRARWLPVQQGGNSELAPLPPEHGDVAGPFRASMPVSAGHEIVYRGFHFFDVSAAGSWQLDFGVNPLACYPFWTAWFRSPGQTRPILEPTGRLWVSPLGSYEDDREWQVLRPRD